MIREKFNDDCTGLFLLIFRHVCWGGGQTIGQKNYNIDYFGYAVNLELNLDRAFLNYFNHIDDKIDDLYSQP